jgi:hypothetical protein
MKCYFLMGGFFQGIKNWRRSTRKIEIVRGFFGSKGGLEKGW